MCGPPFRIIILRLNSGSNIATDSQYEDLKKLAANIHQKILAIPETGGLIIEGEAIAHVGSIQVI